MRSSQCVMRFTKAVCHTQRLEKCSQRKRLCVAAVEGDSRGGASPPPGSEPPLGDLSLQEGGVSGEAASGGGSCTIVCTPVEGSGTWCSMLSTEPSAAVPQLLSAAPPLMVTVILVGIVVA